LRVERYRQKKKEEEEEREGGRERGKIKSERCHMRLLA